MFQLDSKFKPFSPAPLSASGFVILKATLEEWIHPNVNLETTPNRIDLLQYRLEYGSPEISDQNAQHPFVICNVILSFQK